MKKCIFSKWKNDFSANFHFFCKIKKKKRKDIQGMKFYYREYLMTWFKIHLKVAKNPTNLCA